MDRTGPDPNRPIRVFLLSEQRLIAELVKLTLNHGVYVTRHARSLDDAWTILAEWQPQLAIIDMDVQGEEVVRRIGMERDGNRTRIPILALTRRGDLRTKLAAFELGVDFVAESNVVDRHIRSLRIKLQNDWRKPRFIATVPGRGYRFVPRYTDQPVH